MVPEHLGGHLGGHAKGIGEIATCEPSRECIPQTEGGHWALGPTSIHTTFQGQQHTLLRMRALEGVEAPPMAPLDL